MKGKLGYYQKIIITYFVFAKGIKNTNQNTVANHRTKKHVVTGKSAFKYHRISHLKLTIWGTSRLKHAHNQYTIDTLTFTTRTYTKATRINMKIHRPVQRHVKDNNEPKLNVKRVDDLLSSCQNNQLIGFWLPTF